MLLALAATALAPTAVALPAVLSPYVKDGHLDPGDYGWMRGSFPGATRVQQGEWRAVVAWRNQCRARLVATIRADLSRRGVAAQGVDLDNNNDGLCGELDLAGRFGDLGASWPAFQATVARARPVVQAVIWSAALAQAEADNGPPDESAELIARPMTDQVLRLATLWGDGDVKGAPPLDPAARAVARAMLWTAIARRDHANTAWLKALVARTGWPTIGTVGKRASEQGWLLVQHADDDPVFQLDMLRLMEPLAARGEVSKRNYAMLYDRVMLSLTGKQRYGSQAICAAGRFKSLPLEDAAAVDRLRAETGMAPLPDYLAGMDKSFPCPPDVIPPSPPKR